jgi:N-acyl-D-aspartate/D-glutamate deacylase
MREEEAPDASGRSEVLLRGGLVLDGSGSPARREDVRLGSGRVLERGEALAVRGARVVDLSGEYLAPGFVDVHSHSDITVLANPGLESKAMQGVTTEVVGNCGESLFPVSALHRDELAAFVEQFFPRVASRLRWDWNDLASWSNRVAEARPALNLAPLVGHGTLRIATVGLRNGPIPNDRAAELAASLDRALAQGAFGLSTGLAYSPELETTSDDLEPLLERVARAGGVYATHLRDEGTGGPVSVEAALLLAGRTRVRLEISHLKCFGRRTWGSMHGLLRRIARARADGVRVHADMYPYEAGETALTALFPGWLFEGRWEEAEARLRDPVARRRAGEEVEHGVRGWTIGPNDLRWEDVVVSAVATRGGERFLGRNLSEIGRELGLGPFEAAVDLLLRERGGVSVLLFGMAPDDVRAVERDPTAFVGSDGIGNSLSLGPFDGPIHPRNYGAFPRFLADLGREGSLALSAAVRRVTALPCDHFGLADRGSVEVGKVADLVSWPRGAHDAGPEYAERPRYSRLLSSVWVNGVPVVWRGRLTGERPGRVLTRPADRSEASGARPPGTD